MRDELDAALAGAPLSTRDRQFLSKLVHWDKRNAAAVASLLRRARRAGRNEAALTPVQLETVLAALEDAVVHRVAGVGTVGCWDCENVRGGRCAEHSRDFERARDYAELAALLAAGQTVPAALDGEEDELRPAHRAAHPDPASDRHLGLPAPGAHRVLSAHRFAGTPIAASRAGLHRRSLRRPHHGHRAVTQGRMEGGAVQRFSGS